MMDENKIPFIVSFDGKGKKGIGETLLDVVDLRDSLRRSCSKLAEAFEGLREVGAFELEEITLGLEVGAEGGVSFIGTAKASGAASITLKFVPPRRSPQDGE